MDKLNDHQVHTLYQSIQENSNGKIVEYAGSETQILSFNESGALIDTPQTRGTISESDLNKIMSKLIGVWIYQVLKFI